MQCGSEFCFRCNRCCCSECGDGQEVEEELWSCSYCDMTGHIEGMFDRYEEEEE